MYFAWFAVDLSLRMIKELDSVALTTDLPEYGLAKGEIAHARHVAMTA